MNDWQKLTVIVPRETQEAVGEILTELTSGGLEIEDTADYLSYQTEFGEVLPSVEQSDEVKISCYQAEEFSEAQKKEISDRVAKDLEVFGFSANQFRLFTEALSEEDWANSWKKYFHPTRISRDLTIVPSWTEYFPQNSEEKIIRLDPGMAFGTGTHPTTKLTLFALEQTLRGGESMLDVGTGSGVLSIAARLLGAGEIKAYDLDEVAVRVARENIDLNPDMTDIEVSANDLLKGVQLEQKVDIIVANILADILLLMIDDAYELIKDKGYLILSGIISNKKDLVLEKALAAGFKLESQMQQGEWHCLVLQKADEELFFG